MFVVGKLLYNVLTFSLNVILARYLGASVYGVYALSHTIVEACRTFTNLGADKSILRFVSIEDNGWEWRSQIVTLSLLTSILGGGILGGAVFYLTPVITDLLGEGRTFTRVLQLFVPILVLTTLTRLFGNAFRALEHPGYEVLIQRILYPGLSLAAAGLVLVVGHSIVGVMYALVGATLLTLLAAGYLFYSVTDIAPRFGLPASEVTDYYSYSLPLMMKDAGSFLYTRVDVLMVGYFLSSATVGMYNVAILVAGVLPLSLQAVNQIFPAVASRLYSKGEKEELVRTYSTATRWVISVSLPVATVIVVFNREILVLFGSEFGEADLILVAFVLGQLFNTAVGPSGYVLMMTDHQYLVSVNQWFFGVVNVVLNYVLLVRIGLLGAAVATAAVLASLNVVRAVEVWYFEDMIPYRRSYLKPIASTCLAAVPMVAASHLLEGVLALMVGAVLGAGLYVGTLMLLGTEPDDRQLLTTVIQDFS